MGSKLFCVGVIQEAFHWAYCMPSPGVPVFEGQGHSPRSRLGWRCCRRRATPLKVKLPDTPLILAGALGGPFCIFMLTPLRNALTLASQDAGKSVGELYASVFAGGFCGGWTGGLTVVVPSCPQFIVMGPLFHFLKEATGSAPCAVMLSAFCETFISYGSQTVNAQMAFNSERALEGLGGQVPLWNPFIPFGPGSSVHVLRNIVALSGIRVFSGPCQAGLAKFAATVGLGELPAGMRTFFGDFIASMGSAVLSAPLNQLYNFAVTSTDFMAEDLQGKLALGSGFILDNYLVHSADGAVVGLSPTLFRDLFMRCAYVATLYACFGAIERLFVAIWGSRKPAMKRRGTVARVAAT
eukprot:TRINITY_DN96799_c0_g1_i1.p1 TRINITY_DN96799_c0_g1~~TRINITY_DN96799_c0_g1_i1.p1  ORF type:complete len:353 (-),score=53.69 TRINITY_DN96799_c0_g1_i1:49-1107(-)